MKEDENYITLSEPKPIKLTLPPAAATLLGLSMKLFGELRM